MAEYALRWGRGCTRGAEKEKRHNSKKNGMLFLPLTHIKESRLQDIIMDSDLTERTGGRRGTRTVTTSTSVPVTDYHCHNCKHGQSHEDGRNIHTDPTRNFFPRSASLGDKNEDSCRPSPGWGPIERDIFEEEGAATTNQGAYNRVKTRVPETPTQGGNIPIVQHHKPPPLTPEYRL